ncbi:helix-turn-helix domain-containing protein [Achromobacter aegrifaciens]|uniref:helix-turn-helix domain-containing protein n=1 Tax=Achromobacter aegrifaciens TaxID=1287736 RepID=UPI000F73D32E|nr:helix-turn-helix transcriptional regulator [Achromobacter aegrifaciens]RSF02738.1 XRE family transcriptional regulator [Achromobacter aegrifaciens]
MSNTTALDWYKAVKTSRIEEIKLDFAIALEAAAQDEGVSKVELARRTGVSPARITKALRGDSNLTIETMEKLAEAANRTIHIYLAQPECAVYHFDLIDSKEGEIETINEQAALAAPEFTPFDFSGALLKKFVL